MRTFTKAVITSGLLLAVASAGLRAETRTSPEIQRELALEHKYEKLAAMETSLIAEASKEKADNWRQYQLRKAPPSLDIVERDREISRKIAEAQDKRTEYQKLAEWHRFRVSDLQEEL